MATTYTSVVESVGRGGFAAFGPKLGLVEVEIDTGDINSGALVDGDIVQALSLPIGTLILQAGLEVTEAFAGAAQVVLDLGTGDDPDQFVDGSSANAFDVGTSGSQKAVGTYSNMAPSVTTTTAGVSKILSAADTLDLKFAAITGGGATLTAGKVRVWALIADCDGLAG